MTLLEAPRAAVEALFERLQVAARLGVRSGLAFDLTARGATTLVSQLARGRSGPSTIWRVHAANSPDKLGLIFPASEARPGEATRSWTYGELDKEADDLAGGLRALGLTGKTLLVMMKNRPEYLMLGTGAARAGTAMVTVSWRSTPSELAYLVNHSGAGALVVDAQVAATVEKARGELGALGDRIFAVGADVPGLRPFDELVRAGLHQHDAKDEGAVVVYTSGTTGKPKGAVRKFNKELLPAVMRFLAETPMRSDDVHLAACPLYHTTAFGFIAMSQILGATVVLLDEFHPTRFLDAIEHHRVTTTVLVPTMLHRLLAIGEAEIRRRDTRSLAALFCTSAPLPGPDSDLAMDLFGDIVFNLYGATETGVVTLAHPEDLRRSPGTIGRAVPGNDVRLLDDHGHDVPEGKVGELFTKNAMLVAGYHDDEAATRGSMRDGWFSVGDLARRDAHGCYHLEGRKRDMIISGGVNVYPAEVEAILEGHPSVDEVAVIGLPDPEWGERVTAVVVPRDEGGSEAALKSWCKERLAGPKVPRQFVVLEAGAALPRNPTGKVLKRDLRARYAEAR